MSLHNTLVASYAQPRLAEIDLERMRNAGLNLHRLRIITHDPQHFPQLWRDTPMLHSFGDLELDYFGCIPEEDIVDFEAELDTGHMFLIAHGLREDIEEARHIAESTHPTSWDGIADVAVYYGCVD